MSVGMTTLHASGHMTRSIRETARTLGASLASDAVAPSERERPAAGFTTAEDVHVLAAPISKTARAPGNILAIYILAANVRPMTEPSLIVTPAGRQLGTASVGEAARCPGNIRTAIHITITTGPGPSSGVMAFKHIKGFTTVISKAARSSRNIAAGHGVATGIRASRKTTSFDAFAWRQDITSAVTETARSVRYRRALLVVATTVQPRPASGLMTSENVCGLATAVWETTRTLGNVCTVDGIAGAMVTPGQAAFGTTFSKRHLRTTAISEAACPDRIAQTRCVRG